MKSPKSRLESNIWKFYLFRIFGSISFITPIFVLFLQQNGLSTAQVMLLQSAFILAVMFLEVPSGALADLFGRKRALIASDFLFIVGYAVYSLGHNFYQFLIAELLLASAVALFYGASFAFVYDNLAELKQTDRFKKIYGNSLAITYLVGGLAGLFGPYIAEVFSQYGLRMPFWLTLIPFTISWIITFTLFEVKRHKPLHRRNHYVQHIKNAIKLALHHRRIRFLTLYYALTGGILFSVYFLYQPYFEEIKIPLVYFGGIYFVLSLGAAIFSRYAHEIEGYLGERKSLAIISIIPLIGLLGMALMLPRWGFLFIIPVYLLGGLIEVVIGQYTNRYLSPKNRATVTAFRGLAYDLFAAIIAPLLGWAVDVWSLSTSFLISAGLLAFCFAYFWWEGRE